MAVWLGLAVTTFIIGPLAVMRMRSGAAEASPPSPEPPAIKDVYADDFLIGVAVDVAVADGRDDATARLVARHFNCLTAENHMKWSLLRRDDGSYDFAAADAIVAFAEAHGMTVIGHTLVWHQMTPEWVFTDSAGPPVSREELLSRLAEHVRTVVGRYRGKIRGWDVVNEAVAERGPDLLRDSPWRRIIGDDYVEQAFRLAAEVDPDAELYYNDFGLTDPAKRERTIRLIRNLQAAGVRVHAVGMQGHWNLENPSPQAIAESIKAFAALGVKVNITELDVSLFSSDRKDNPYKEGAPPEVLTAQGRRYAELFELFRRHRDVIDRVTFWGATDRHSWLNNHPVRGRTNHPLLFDRAGQPKPAFQAVVDPVGFLSNTETAKD